MGWLTGDDFRLGIDAATRSPRLTSSFYERGKGAREASTPRLGLRLWCSRGRFDIRKEPEILVELRALEDHAHPFPRPGD